MKRFLEFLKFRIGDIFAASPDVGSGLIIATGLSFYFSLHLLDYIVSGFFAILPDFDVAIKFVLKKTKAVLAKLRHQPEIVESQLDSHHRALLHRPIFFVLVFCVWMLLAIALHRSLLWPLMFILDSLAHFVHDSLGEYNQNGEEFNIGVSWLPFDQRSFVLFGKVDGRIRLLVTKPAGFVGMEHKQWLKTLYFRFNPRLFVELGWFVLGLLLATARIMELI